MKVIEKNKKPINSKKKGNGFEGSIAKLLSKELAPLNFIRSPGSGARVGGKNFETIGQLFGVDTMTVFVGDVVPVNEKQEKKKFKFSIECKFYRDVDTFTQLMSGNANIYKWFLEAKTDCVKINKLPLLIFKWNRTDTFVCMENDLFFEGDFIEIKSNKHNLSLKITTLDNLVKQPLFWIDNE